MIYKNNTPALTLAAAIGTTDTTVTVNEDVSWVEPPMTFVIDPGQPAEEAVYVTAVDTVNKTLTVIRGIDGYTAQSHSAGAEMRHMVIARDIYMGVIKRSFRAGGNLPSPRWYYSSMGIYRPIIGQKSATVNLGRITFTMIYCPFPATLQDVSFYCSTAGSADGTTNMAIYDADPFTFLPKNKLFETATSLVLSAAGLYTVTGIGVKSDGYPLWVALVHNGYTTAPALWVIDTNNNRATNDFFYVISNTSEGIRNQTSTLQVSSSTFPAVLTETNFNWGAIGFPSAMVSARFSP